MGTNVGWGDLLDVDGLSQNSVPPFLSKRSVSFWLSFAKWDLQKGRCPFGSLFKTNRRLLETIR